MTASDLFKQILQVWRETVIDLGLIALLLTGLALSFILVPVLLMPSGSLLGLAVLVPLLFLTVFGFYVAQCFGFVVVDDYLDHGELRLGLSVERTTERLGPIIVAIVLLTLGGAASSFLFMVPGIILTVFSLVYLPAVCLTNQGALQAIPYSARIISKHPMPLLILAVIFSVAPILGAILVLIPFAMAAFLFQVQGVFALYGFMAVLSAAIFFGMGPLMWASCTIAFRAMAAGPAHAPAHAPAPLPHDFGAVPSTSPASSTACDPPANTAQFAARPITIETEAVSYSDPPPASPLSAPSSPDNFVGFQNTMEFQASLPGEEDPRLPGFTNFDDSLSNDDEDDEDPDLLA